MTLTTDSNHKKNKSLFAHLMFWFLVLSLIPMSITSWINYQQAKQNVLSVTEDKLYQSSESRQKFIQNWFSYRTMDINVHARAQVNLTLLNRIHLGWKNSNKLLKEYVNSENWLLDIDLLQDDLITLSQNYDYIYDVFLIDNKGNILFTVKNEDDLGNNLLQEGTSASKFAKIVFSTLKHGTVLFSDIERYAPSKGLISGFLTAPIMDSNDEVAGVFAIQLRFDKIFERMMRSNDVNTSETHYLVAQDGLLRTPIFNDLSTVLTQEIKTKQFKLWLAEHTNNTYSVNQKEIVFDYIGPSGNKVLGVHQLVVINNINWVLISEIDRDEVFKTTYQMAKTVAIVLLFSIFFIITIAYFQVKRIITPLHKLSEASRNVALGKGNQQVDIDAVNEIGQLASAFNNMLTKQQQTELQISKSNEQLRGVLSELSSQQYALDQHAIVAITDKSGNITFVNDKFCEISGYNQDQLIGSNHRLLNSGFHPKSFFTDMYRIIT